MFFCCIYLFSELSFESGSGERGQKTRKNPPYNKTLSYPHQFWKERNLTFSKIFLKIFEKQCNFTWRRRNLRSGEFCFCKILLSLIAPFSQKSDDFRGPQMNFVKRNLQPALAGSPRIFKQGERIFSSFAIFFKKIVKPLENRLTKIRGG